MDTGKTRDQLKEMNKIGLPYSFIASFLGVKGSSLCSWLWRDGTVPSKHVQKIEWLYNTMQDLMTRFKAQFGEAS